MHTKHVICPQFMQQFGYYSVASKICTQNYAKKAIIWQMIAIYSGYLRQFAFRLFGANQITHIISGEGEGVV